MRVLIVQKRFHPNSIGLVKALQTHGHEVRMIVYRKSMNNPTEYNTALEPVHIPYYDFFYRFWKRFNKSGLHKFSVPRLSPIFQELRAFRPDLVVLKTYRAPNLIVGVLACLLGFERVLLTDNSPLTEALWKKVLVKRLGLTNRICTTVSASAALINGWVDGARFLPYPVEISEKFNEGTQENGRIKILCAGSLNSPRKRPWWVVEAVHSANLDQTVEITFAGLGTPESESARRIFSLAEAYGLQDRIRIIYNTPHAEMNSLYAQHHLLVHPARLEGFGAVVLEAMASGLPVLCSDEVGAQSCFVQGQSGMIFPAESIDAMTTCLKQMCADPVNLFLMGKKARQRVENLYTGAAFVKHLESLVT